MGIAEFIIGPAVGRTRWLDPSSWCVTPNHVRLILAPSTPST
jgi:hypothetical protein